MEFREAFKRVYKSVMILVTLGFGGGAFAAWWYSTPGNGLLLISGILAILALMAGLSINKLDWQDRQAETYREIGEEARSLFGGLRTARGSDGKLSFTFSSVAPVTVDFAEPEVHRVDSAMLGEAKRMAAEGAAIDDICRSVDSGFDSHDELHRLAFRKLVQAMIEQG